MKTQNQVKLKYSQNFLKSPDLVRKLVNRACLDKTNLVYEIGPGRGIITKALSDYCGKVIAVEKDRKLYENLCQKFSQTQNVQIIYGDFLQTQLPEREAYKVFSNIPFALTADIVAKLTEAKNSPEDAYLIVQQEAAVKYAGVPYGSERLRSLAIKPRFELKILYRFKRVDFSPIPRVDIVLLQIKKRDDVLVQTKNVQIYNDFIAFGFSQSTPSRTTLKDIYKKIFADEQFRRLSKDLKFALLAKPSDLTFEQWLGLFNYFLVGVAPNKKTQIYGLDARLKTQQNRLIKVHRTRKY